MLEFLGDKDEIHLGIDEQSFRQRDLLYSVTEVKERRMLGILRDDHIDTLKRFGSVIFHGPVEDVFRDGS